VARIAGNARRREMKTYPEIDYAFRPESYWSSPDPLSLILSHVKGSNRREMIRDYWNAGVLKELDDDLLKDTLTEAERNRIGKIHPTFMGGEYLPDFKVGEEEIVRIELASTTADVISVRARPVSGGIAWRVVDEYPNDGEYTITPEVSARPLTLAELISLLDEGSYSGGIEGGLILGWNNVNLDCGGGKARDLRNFTSVESPHYSDLSSHYENVFDDWEKEKTKSRDVDVDGTWSA
jgi:hypothetical protein